MTINFHSIRIRDSYSGREADATWMSTLSALVNPLHCVVVDIGCGGGIYSKSWAQMGAAKVIGIDSSAVMIKDAKINCANETRISFALSDATATGLPSASADIVFARALVHHLQNLEYFFREAWRILKPGGVLLIQDRTPEDISVPASHTHIRGYLFEQYPKLLSVDLNRRPNRKVVRQGLVAAGLCQIVEAPLWETRRIYESFAPLESELLSRKARSILHELTDVELQSYVSMLGTELRGVSPIVERDSWTIWKAKKPLDKMKHPTVPPIRIRPFESTDQAAAKDLILTGLGEHFGFIDYTINPDLDDIQHTYVDAGNLFLVAETGGEVIATGCLTNEEGVGRMVRISVRPAFRRCGIGSQIVKLLLAEAHQRGHHYVYLKTIPTWEDAVGLYSSLGFETEETTDATIRMGLHF